MLYESSNLESLFLTGEELVDLEKLSHLDHLESLLLYGKQIPDDPNQFSKLSQVKRLTITDGTLVNLNSLKTLTQLEELNLWDCNKLEDLTALAELGKLKRLGFSDCKSLTNYQPIKNLTNLTRLSIAGELSQVDFDLIIPPLKQLDILYLYECDNLTSFASLELIPGLDCLSLSQMDIKPEAIFNLNHLSYLAFPKDLYEEDGTRQQFEEHMPNTVLVPTDALCLGSGWLLLLIPGLLLVVLFYQIRKKKLTIQS